MKIKKIISVLVIMAMFFSIVSISTISNATISGEVRNYYEANKNISAMKVGDILYFDNTGLYGWDNVYVHMWTNGGSSMDWDNSTQMTKVEGSNNLFSFEITGDYAGYDRVIFKSYKSGNKDKEFQTKSLAFIETGLAFKINGTDTSGKRTGYWYLEDKNTIIKHLKDVEEYKKDKEYYTESSYSNLDKLIQEANNQLNNEVTIETQNNIDYYISIAPKMNEIFDVIDNLVVNTEPLEERISEEEVELDDYSKIYTKDSVDNLKNAIKNGKDLIESTNITVNDVKDAIKEIDDAYNSLKEKVSKTKLKKLLDATDNIDESLYTEESLNNYKIIKKSALDVYNNENATQDVVNNHVEKLKEAIKALTGQEIEIDEEEQDAEEEQTLSEEKELSEEQKSSNEQNNSKNVKENSSSYYTPKTGDTTLLVFGSILIVALVVFLITVILNKKNKKNR